MKLRVDLHIHSRYSLATSKNLTPESLDYWANVKGLSVIGTGDASHPAWLSECETKLEQDAGGLYVLRKEYRGEFSRSSGLASDRSGEPVRFILSAEVSTIYRKDGRVRKVHHLILLPDFEAARSFQRLLSRVGNITSDGRPILGLDSRDLLEIVLTASDRAILIPAHIWTPWFSTLGDKSGFDSIDACYGDLASHITAVETGLSSDPPMNWCCSFLDRFSIISNSDAHSPEKLGREATIIDSDLSYDGIVRSFDLSSGGPGVLGTIEFFPQEGKYHFDGHRKCCVVFSPEESLRHGNICPVCGKRLVLGVMHRVEALADRERIAEENLCRPNMKPYLSLIPLKEILAEILRTGDNSRRVTEAYDNLVRKAGSEFSILIDLSIAEIESISGELLAEAVRRMRNKEVHIEEGYDGEFGRITVFAPSEEPIQRKQEGLFAELAERSPGADVSPEKAATGKPPRTFEMGDTSALAAAAVEYAVPDRDTAEYSEASPFATTEEQERAIRHGLPSERVDGASIGPSLIIAGPGTGKTRTLALKIACLIREGGIDPSSILALTFTVKAAEEMSERIGRAAQRVTALTFHAFGRAFLAEYHALASRTEGFSILTDVERARLCEEAASCTKGVNGGSVDSKLLSRSITLCKQKLKSPSDLPQDDRLQRAYAMYEKLLIERNAFDFDDLVFHPVLILMQHREILHDLQARYTHLFVDEYQDVNEAQYTLVRLLAPDAHSSLCVIGDPDQAIYGFRGADPRFIGQFLSDYPGASVFKLSTSFRCPQSVISAAQDVIGNRGLTAVKKSEPVGRVSHPTDKSEAEWIARRIEQMTGGMRFFSIDSGVASGEGEDYSLKDFAILVRLTAQMEALEKALTDHGIPYQKVGDDSWASTGPMPALCALLNLIDDPSEAAYRDIPFPEGGTVKPAWRDVKNTADEIASLPLAGKIERLAERFFPELRSSYTGALERLKRLSTMYSRASDLVSAVSVEQAQDGFNPKTEAVALMTIHAAKGLEFPVVFIAGCEEGILPFTLFDTGEERIEEEKRLFYVGMTRAGERLFISHATSRSLFGRKLKLGPSRFLSLIHDADCVDIDPGTVHRGRTLQFDLFE